MKEAKLNLNLAYGSLFAHPNEVGVKLQLVRLCYRGHPRLYYILINCPEPNELNRDRLLNKALKVVFFLLLFFLSGDQELI